jgi:myo-inositol-1(or 4)-monophosphatase
MLLEIEAIAREAGAVALGHQASMAALEVTAKGHLDLVTAADRAVEHLIAERLLAAFPDDGIHGEEGAAVPGRTGRVWVVDPIDGTFNFVRGGDQWAVSIGLYEGGRPRLGVIHAPVRAWTLTGGIDHPPLFNGKPLPPLSPFASEQASVGVGFHPSIPVEARLAVLGGLMGDLGVSIRYCGSATISLLEVVRGQTDAYLGMGESTWDVMAALPILQHLGAASTLDWQGVHLDQKLRFCVGKPELVARLASLVPTDRQPS